MLLTIAIREAALGKGGQLYGMRGQFVQNEHLILCTFKRDSIMIIIS
jgi:hypothetical protein